MAIPTRPATTPTIPAWPHGPSACRSCTGTVTFFFGLLCVVSLVAGLVIIVMSAKLAYLGRVFPRVAEHNYRVLRADLAAMEQRLLRATDLACRSGVPAQPPQLQ